jgi:ribosomal protein S27AE
MATMAGVPVEERSDKTAWSWTRILATGACPRCGGLLVREPFADLLDDTASRDLAARRCVQCGEVIDPTILGNRASGTARRVVADRRVQPVLGSAERS